VFARRKRLKREDIKTVLRRGVRLSSKHFTAVLSKDHFGYAVIVPKKVARLSATRHRIKRRTLEALGKIEADILSSVILYPRASVLDLEYDELKRELNKLLL
jgi:ribonuclease P protein component